MFILMEVSILFIMSLYSQFHQSFYFLFFPTINHNLNINASVAYEYLPTSFSPTLTQTHFQGGKERRHACFFYLSWSYFLLGVVVLILVLILIMQLQYSVIFVKLFPITKMCVRCYLHLHAHILINTHANAVKIHTKYYY